MTNSAARPSGNNAPHNAVLARTQILRAEAKARSAARAHRLEAAHVNVLPEAPRAMLLMPRRVPLPIVSSKHAPVGKHILRRVVPHNRMRVPSSPFPRADVRPTVGCSHAAVAHLCPSSLPLSP